MRALIVDDIPQNRYLLCTILRAAGFEVQEADNGARALALAVSEPPSLVVSDLLMPVMDGFTLLCNWKTHARLCKVPFIVYTATYTNADDERLALSLGADAFIVKPAEPDAFIARVHEVLERVRHQNVRGPQVDAAESLRQHNDALTRKLSERTAELEVLNRELTTSLKSRGQEESLLRAVLRGLPGMFYLFDEQGRFLQWNQRFEQVSGYSAEEIANMHPLQLFGDEDRPLIAQRIGAVFSEGAATVDAEFMSKSGERTAYHFTGQRAEIAGKVYLVGTAVDLSARRRAEASLSAALAWQRAIVDAAPVAIVSTDQAGVIQTVNAAAEHMLGRAAAELLGKASPSLFFEPTELADAMATLQRLHARTATHPFEHLVAAGDAAPGEWTFVRADGARLPVRLKVTAVLDTAGKCAGYLGVFEDLSARKQQEVTRRLQAAALDAAANGIVITDRHGRIEYVNPAWATLTGFERDAVLGKTPAILNAGIQDKRFYRGLWDTILRGEVWRAELTNRRKDGTLYPEEETITPVRNERGEITHFIAIKQDISERRRAEDEQSRLQEQLRVSDKLRAIGSLAGGIAHDFNNLLLVILSCAELSLQRDELRDDLREDLTDIKRAAERAAELTRQLLAFGRKQVLRVAPLDLDRTTARMAPILRRLLGETIELRLLRGPDLGLVIADESQIEQVVMNLAVNARDAMPNGGKLTLESVNVMIDAEQAMRLGCQPGPFVMLAVTDTGVGMDADTKLRIFEPFFTTKEQGKGTGLGLATVHGIVEQNGGRIWVYSEVGRGTTFKTYFPRADPSSVATYTERPPTRKAVGTETVLVVEDESAVRAVIERVLLASGYSVLLAAHGVAALELVQDHRGSLDLVLTDVAMPGLSGPELVERLRARRTDFAVLFMSGYANEAIVKHGLLQEGVHFISKPFSSDGLVNAVRDALDRR